MTSKERVWKTFQLERADRVPLDYMGEDVTNEKMMRHFGVTTYEALLEALQIDYRNIIPKYTGPRLHPEIPDRIVDPMWGVRKKFMDNAFGGSYDYCDFPLETASVEEVAAYPLPNLDDFDYETVLEYCKAKKDYAISVGNPAYGDIINGTGMFRGMEQVFIDLITDDEAGALLRKRRHEKRIGIIERTLDKCRDYVDFIWIGEDLGTQIAPIISMDLYQKHIRPFHKEYCDLAKAYGKKIMIHTCGYSSWAYDEFIKLGFDAVDTLQPEVETMKPSQLVERFGGRLSFHGCISTAGCLAYGTCEDMVNNVKETLDIMMPCNGYAIAPTHNIQGNTPVENIVALYETALQYGAYSRLG